MVSQCFASFRNSWFDKLLQGFARVSKWTFTTIRQGLASVKNHGFSQGFAMSTLLMHTGSQNATRRAKEKVTARNYYISSRGVETKHNCTGKRTMGSLARAGSEARPGSERRRLAAGRRPVPSTGQNTILPAHSGLRPLFTTVTEERI